jgi:tetratricopeptide (TPR) repeat protein
LMAGIAKGFGGEVRRLMAERHVGLRELARQVSYDPGYLSKVVNGRKPVSGDLARRLDAALDAGGVLAAFAAVPGLNGSFTSDDEERLVLAARRPRRVDQGVVASLATILAAQRRLEDRVGSASMLKAAVAQLGVVSTLASEARAPVRSDVLSIAGQYAQFAGWLSANTRQLADASGWYDRALEWAAESGDANMTATALNMKGYVSWLEGKVGPMIGLSQAAQSGHAISAGVRALAVQQEARGHALAGDGDRADRKLDEAASLIARTAGHPEDEPPWIYFYSADYLVLQRGLAYLFLGRYAQAIDLLSAGLAEMPAEVGESEWIAWYLVRLAAAHAHAGDAEQACAVAARAVLIARQTSSSRLRAQLCRLRAQLATRWPGLPAVAELAELLS